MANSLTSFPGRRPFGTQTAEQPPRVCSYGHPLPSPRKYDYLDISYSRTQPLRLARDIRFQYPKQPKQLEPYGVCKECDRIRGLDRMRYMTESLYFQQARSRAAASQDPPFPNNLRTYPRSDGPPVTRYQRRPWTDPTAAGADLGLINPVQPPPSGRNNDFSGTASVTSTASSSRSSYFGSTNPTTSRQNYQAPYSFQPPSRRRNTYFSDTASILSTTSSSSRSSYSS